MGLFTFISNAVYKEPVLTWALGMYGTGLAFAIIVPNFHDKHKTETPKNPPTLKQVIAGLQEKLGA